MAPVPNPPQIDQPRPGPHPSHVQVAKPFIFEQKIQSQILVSGSNPQAEDNYRLDGVNWINSVRRALQLPARTFNTAVIYYHKFRFVHKDNEYQYAHAAAAALFAACKIEDTLKKSKDIICASFNMKLPASEQITPDDPSLDSLSKTVIGLERLMLEASGFDFRNRHPQRYLLKLSRKCGMDKNVTRIAYKMMTDLYCTFAPLKQSSSAMAFGCLELTTRLLHQQQHLVEAEIAASLRKWRTNRAQIVEVMLDLLDLYTHFQSKTLVGPYHAIDTFIKIRIALNQEATQKQFPRYSEWKDPKTNGYGKHILTPKTPATPTSPADGRAINQNTAHPSPGASSGSGRQGVGARGQDGTVRFMLEGAQAKEEKAAVAQYFDVEMEDYEVEVDEPVPVSRHDSDYRGSRGRGGHWNGHDSRDDRPYRKRGRASR